MEILRVGDTPLALCIDYSKRRASLEKQIQDTDFKGFYRYEKIIKKSRRRGFAGSATAKRQARLAALFQLRFINAG